MPRNLVLLLASTMVSIGLVAILVTTMGGSGPELDETGRRIEIDSKTPEVAAESFLDAWRKRDHDLAAGLSIGNAHDAVEARREEDEALDPEEREIKEQVWDSMAAEGLRLNVSRATRAARGRLRIEGMAEGHFLGEPYRREVEFTMLKQGERWYVEEMRLGQILSDPPSAFDLGGQEREDPAAIPMRGEDIP